MHFEEILDQAIAMLQRRGRVTYRALKRQFNLDDAFLEDLTVELIKGQRLARDEDGEVLVWIGDAAPPAVPPPTPLPATGPDGGQRRSVIVSAGIPIRIRSVSDGPDVPTRGAQGPPLTLRTLMRTISG